ncbi:MAG: response regulator, partial [Kiritimatiellaceae bacterium]|nr:response regulator [Kiritimatiellaceae bacterium]
MSKSASVVLFVDDEENVLKSLERYLVRESYERRFARSGAAAIQMMEKEAIDVIVSDMRMPGMDGI